MTVSLIFTVKNEAASLPRLLDSIAAQTRTPDEIIVVDGGSTDATLDVLHSRATDLPIKIITQPGANISQGRNSAIRAAQGDIICSTDAGVRLDACWMEELLKPLEANDGKMQFPKAARALHSVDIVSGFFVPDPQGVFEIALAATTLPLLEDIHPDTFLPSSRSIAFCKRAWEQVNGYPEWLDYCEDLIFDFALRRAQCQFAFAVRAVAHFRPRSNLSAFFKQYYLYARGDGKANLWLLRHLIRYMTYLVALPLVLALVIRVPLLGLGIVVVGLWGMFFTPFKRLTRISGDLSWLDRFRAATWIPLIRVTGDIAKMIGYPIGVAWRIRYR